MLGPHLVILGSGLEQWGSQMLHLGRSLATALRLACKAVVGPPMQFMLAVMQALGQLMLPVWQVSSFCYMTCVSTACWVGTALLYDVLQLHDMTFSHRLQRNLSVWIWVISLLHAIL